MKSPINEKEVKRVSFPEVTAKLSPMMRQYLEIKQKHEDALLFYRLGDFYEMFFDDAVTASKELELVLTGRDCGLPERAPMCGVPFHSCEGYIAKLIQKGYKVAVCEQVEDPALAKGIVKREIIRVVTPGTVVENSMLSEESNNYVCCLFFDVSCRGMCFADISTGSVFVTETTDGPETVVNELSRFAPREILLNARAQGNKRVTDFIVKTLGVKPTLIYDEGFDLTVCRQTVFESFSGESCDRLAELREGAGVRALGVLVRYLRDTQFHGADRLTDFEVYRCAQFMSLSASCRRNLELVASARTGERRGSLLWVIDRTRTPAGKRLLKAFIDRPLVDVGEINRRLDAVEEMAGDPVCGARMGDALSQIKDIERMMTRVIYRTVSPRELIAFASACEGLKALKTAASALTSPLASSLCGAIDPLDDLARRVTETISENPPALMKDGGYIKKGFSGEIDELRQLVGDSKSYLAELEMRLKEQLGIKNLKVGYNRVFGYYIEVPRAFSSSVPDTFVRKQTLATGERYINEELKELEGRILSAAERIAALEREAYEELLVFLEGNAGRVGASAHASAYLDVLHGFAKCAQDNAYTRPDVDGSGVVEIKGGRHPVVEQVIDGGLFVPNDTLLDRGENLAALITGPNMAGKSTYMRQTALIVILAQIGCFVPAKSAHIGVVDAVFTRVGASDDIFSGDSTFMVEMREVAEILDNATANSLVILDEIGRGTSTYDGMSIARAVVEEICREGGIGAKTMFATHYHELCELEDVFCNIKNYNIAVKKRGDDITFLRKIVRGGADESYGIEVAKLAGLPETAIERAKEILHGIERGERAPLGPLRTPEREEESRAAAEIMRELARIDIDTLTPIEAMLKLGELAGVCRRG